MQQALKYLLPFLCIIIINITPAFSETVTFTKEYTYQASEFDSKASSRTIAIEQVKRLLLEELGTYLESQTEVKNFEMSKDKITALTAGIVQTQIIDEKWDGKNYWMKAVVKADPEAVAKSLDELRKNQKKTEDLEDVKKNQDSALKEIERLRNEVASLKNDIKSQEKYNKSLEVLRRQEKVSASNDSVYVKATAPLAYPHKVKKTKKTIASTDTPQGYKYVGSSKAKKYHYLTCKWAQKISPANRVYFRTAKEAREAGYVPCKVCKPPLTD